METFEMDIQLSQEIRTFVCKLLILNLDINIQSGYFYLQLFKPVTFLKIRNFLNDCLKPALSFTQ